MLSFTFYRDIIAGWFLGSTMKSGTFRLWDFIENFLRSLKIVAAFVTE
jgi:hypothetical protein